MALTNAQRQARFRRNTVTLIWRVYRDGEVIAACRDIEDAAAILGMTGSGVIKRNAKIVYRYGDGGTDPANSVDEVAKLVLGD